jgi:hypothetical protein
MPTVLRINDFIFSSLQGTLFAHFSWAVNAKKLSAILSLFSDTFDSAPLVLPVPEDAPLEIPRVILRSNDKQWTLEIAANRVNYRWTQMAEAQHQGVKDFADILTHFVQVLLGIEPTRVGRIACIAARYLLAERPASLLSRHFCKENWLERALPDSEAFELHSLRKTRIGQKFDVNSWIRFKSGQLAIPSTPVRPIVLVEQDINTLAETEGIAEYKYEEVVSFYSLVEVELENRFRSFLEI